MPTHISQLDASEAHPDHFVSRDAMCTGLTEASRQFADAQNEDLDVEGRLEHLNRGMKILADFNAGPEMVGIPRAKLEGLAGSLQRAKNPSLLYSAQVAESGDEPYYT